ncbi:MULTISPECIES: carbohydrate ABC transporter permease [Sellimonas]|nr:MULTISPECIES: sugar ABC transporter permease [Sellimonas]
MMKKQRKFWRSIAPYGYVMPISLILLTFVVASLVISVIFSFMKYNLLLPPEFLGLENYKRLLTDEKMHLALGNTLKIMIMVVPLQVVLSVLFATLIAARKNSLAGKIAKAAIFIPVISSSAVVGTVWKTMLNGRNPVIQGFFSAFGIDTGMLLGSSTTAIITVAMIMVWKNFGYYMVLNLASLTAIPDSYYEAAKVDGGGVMQRFIHITLPLLKPAIIMDVFLSVVMSLQSFDLIYTMTGGGPSNSTLTMVMYAYDQTFQNGKAGYAMAVSNLLFLIVLSLLMLQKGFMKREASEI